MSGCLPFVMLILITGFKYSDSLIRSYVHFNFHMSFSSEGFSSHLSSLPRSIVLLGYKMVTL